MAASNATLSLLLLVSLVSLSPTKTTATLISHCTVHPDPAKCAHDIESAFIGVGSAKSKGIPLVLDAINAAQANYIKVLHFLSTKQIESHLSISLKAAINTAMHQLSDASKVLHGKTSLSSSELHEVQNFLKIAHGNVAKCTTGLKHANSNKSINASLRFLINQSINLTAVSLNIIGQLCAKVSVGSTIHS